MRPFFMKVHYRIYAATVTASVMVMATAMLHGSFGLIVAALILNVASVMILTPVP